MDWFKYAKRVEKMLEASCGVGLKNVKGHMPEAFWEYVKHFGRQRADRELSVIHSIVDGRRCLKCGKHPVAQRPFVKIPDRGTFRENAWRYGRESAYCVDCLEDRAQLKVFRKENRLTSRDWISLQMKQDRNYAKVIKRSRAQAVKSREKTCLAVWGAANPMLSARGKKHNRDMIRKKLGVDNPMFNAEVRAKYLESMKRVDREAVKAKVKSTCLQRYGVTHWMKQDGEFEKVLRKRYGVGNPMDLPGVRAKHKAALIAAGADGRLGASGARNGMNTVKGWANYLKSIAERDQAAVAESRRKTWLRKYGVDHYMKVPEIAQRVRRAGFQIKSSSVCGRHMQYQGYELPVLVSAMKRYGASNVVGQFEEGCPNVQTKSGSVYYPDLWIKSTNTCVEVKGMYTLFAAKKLCEKASAVREAGMKFKIIVADSGDTDARLFTVPDDWDTIGPVRTAAELIRQDSKKLGHGIPKRIRVRALELLQTTREE